MNIQSIDKAKSVYAFGHPDAEGVYRTLTGATASTTDANVRTFGAVSVKAETGTTKKGVRRVHIVAKVPLVEPEATSVQGTPTPNRFAQVSLDVTLPNDKGVLADIAEYSSGVPTTQAAANLQAAALGVRLITALALSGVTGSTGYNEAYGAIQISDLVAAVGSNAWTRGLCGLEPLDHDTTYKAVLNQVSE